MQEGLHPELVSIAELQKAFYDYMGEYFGYGEELAKAAFPDFPFTGENGSNFINFSKIRTRKADGISYETQFGVLCLERVGIDSKGKPSFYFMLCHRTDDLEFYSQEEIRATRLKAQYVITGGSNSGVNIASKARKEDTDE